MDKSRDVDPCENFVIQNECNNLSYNKCCRTHNIRTLMSMYWAAYISFILSFDIFVILSLLFTHFSLIPSSFFLVYKSVVYVCMCVCVCYPNTHSAYKNVEVKSILFVDMQKSIGSNICGNFFYWILLCLLVGILFVSVYASHANRISFFCFYFLLVKHTHRNSLQ